MYISHSPEETAALGEAWGRAATSGLVIALSGDLGAGKTQLAKGIARGLGIVERVHSPTFALDARLRERARNQIKRARRSRGHFHGRAARMSVHHDRNAALRGGKFNCQNLHILSGVRFRRHSRCEPAGAVDLALFFEN